MPTSLLASLELVCSACDGLNPPGALKCLACQKPLREPPGPTRAEPAPPGLRQTSKAPAAAPKAPAPAPKAPTLSRTAAQAKTPPTLVPAKPGRQAGAPVAETVPAKASAASQTAPVAGSIGAGPRFGVAVIAGPGRGQRFRLPTAGAGIGRQRGGILFPEDACVSPQHAALVVRGGRLHVRDEASTSGVFLSISGEEPVAPSGSFIAGQRLFRYGGPLGPSEPPAPGKPQAYGAPIDPGKKLHRVEEILTGGRPGRAVVCDQPRLTIGQGSCDLSFPPEEGLAPLHCELRLSPTGAVLIDRSDGLGTFVRLPAGTERPLQPGDRLRIGQQTLLVELMSG